MQAPKATRLVVDASVAASTSQLEQLEFHEVAKLTGDGPELVEIRNLS